MSLRLKAGSTARALRGHPWVYHNELDRILGHDYDGRSVALEDAGGRLLGSGVYNTRSMIPWRRFDFGRRELDDGLLRERIEVAVSRRSERECRRVVWSDSDRLPGLIVDQYGDVVVAQLLTRAIDSWSREIVHILGEVLRPKTVIIRNDAPVRRLEGLQEVEAFTAHGELRFSEIQCRVGEIKVLVDLKRGHKTGLYLDQQEEYVRISGLSGARVLDACCNQGGFALHCAKRGATSVVGVDSSRLAIDRAIRNAAINGLSIDFRVEDIFQFLAHDTSTWDLVVLDPPPFARSKSNLFNALKAYKQLNRRAIQRLAPGGFLATYSCSHHVTSPRFQNVLAHAASEAKRSVVIRAKCDQPPDHPVLLGFPESEYLNGFLLQAF